MRKTLLTALFLVCASFVFAQTTPPSLHVALLIDDGPTPDQLEKFIELFKRESIHATFSFIAKNVEAHPELAKAAATAGHEIANHSYEHQHPARLSESALEHEVIGALAVFDTEAGIHPAWYWPPFVEITPDLEKVVAKTKTTIYRPKHLIVSSDYMNNLSADEIRKRALNGVKDGSTILFHEWRKETLEQMPQIIAELRQRGATFVTISELTNYLNSTKVISPAPTPSVQISSQKTP